MTALIIILAVGLVVGVRWGRVAKRTSADHNPKLREAFNL